MAGEFWDPTDFHLSDYDIEAGSCVAGSTSILPGATVELAQFWQKGDHLEEPVVGGHASWTSQWDGRLPGCSSQSVEGTGGDHGREENALGIASRAKLVHTESCAVVAAAAPHFDTGLKGKTKMEKHAPSFDPGAATSAVLGKGLTGGARAALHFVDVLMDKTKRKKQIPSLDVGAATGVGPCRRASRAVKRAVFTRDSASRSLGVSQSRSFADNFVPYRRVISCDDDLLALDTLPTSVHALHLVPLVAHPHRVHVVHVGCLHVVNVVVAHVLGVRGTVQGLCKGCTWQCG